MKQVVKSMYQIYQRISHRVSAKQRQAPPGKYVCFLRILGQKYTFDWLAKIAERDTNIYRQFTSYQKVIHA